jgi:membrane protein YqaA with SNARE-associated domain
MSTPAVFLLFAVSESLLGLIPPDFFILWSRKFLQPWLIITFLAFISYFGGIVSYQLGTVLRNIPRISNYINQKFTSHFKKIKRWGALFIIVAALFPLPYSTICMVSGILNYPFKVFVFLGLVRIIRFYFYGAILFGLLN